MLSLTDHPDKKIATYIKEHEGVEPPDDIRKEIDDAWALIVKAHETLTDELSYENWLKYGNPDGKSIQ